ncbi:MAG: hypothetical protein AABY22_23695, partial [Nanoarchaeota archaeon]
MSCQDCEEIQNIAFNKNVSDSPPIAYFRVGNSNMAIVGCNKHCKELIDRLRNTQNKSKARKNSMKNIYKGILGFVIGAIFILPIVGLLFGLGTIAGTAPNEVPTWLIVVFMCLGGLGG